ncbi:glycosyltransferase family protein [Desulfospira joergensenii]|uniref:glycosyltransferase family protein n=1 Tax=Desulfospira joergensenii TaxID=53329 RepID=UPI0003B5532A|nr:glycosyltransferase [Desulfospira joergensenii]
MKILIYCQHVLGVGHFFRTLELARAMEGFQVILVTGGGQVDVPLPNHIRQVRLEGLMMDRNFSGLHCVNPAKDLEEVKQERKGQLLGLMKKEDPDLLLIELFPFGRRAFRFELIPMLEYVKSLPEGRCKVVCSLRDILVEKSDPQKYETRVIEALNLWFDAVLIHSDPRLIKLDATFSRLDQIRVPLVYTGFVTPLPDPDTTRRLWQAAGLKPGERFIVASAGGGNVGAGLLRAAARAVKTKALGDIRLQIYTGPYMELEEKKALHDLADDRIQVQEFAKDFVSLLAAADLSISLAGYNTCMNIVAAKVPSLVRPFAQNREQRERAMNLARFTPMTLLEDQDLEPLRLSRIIMEALDPQEKRKSLPDLDISGARNTADWLKKQIKKGTTP